MAEWWTYELSDFLMFAPRTYYRLIELYNAELWPAHLAALGLGLALLVVSLRHPPWTARSACAMLAACWLWVAWAFHLQRYATINWAANGFAAAFAIEGVLLLGAAAFGVRLRISVSGNRASGRGVRYTGLGLLLFAVLVQPWVGVVLGRPWTQAEVFGIAPDPTAVGTLGVLLLLRFEAQARRPRRTRLPALMFWPIPVLWCLISGATLWTMQAPDALLLPLAALVALLAAWRARTPG